MIPFIIFPEEKRAFAWHFTDVASFWTPSESQVRAAESDIRKFIQKNHLAIHNRYTGYRIQFAGIESRKKEKFIFANYFCSEMHEWQSTEVDIDDGGDCYFQVKFCLANNLCFDFSVNGQA